MKFAARGGSDFTPVPEGTHIAVCDMIVYLGLQPGSPQYPDAKHKVYVRWQISSERVEYEKDGVKQEGPRVAGQEYTASMHEKARLRKDVETWRGKKFANDGEAEAYDINVLLGKACMLNVVHKTTARGTFANVCAVMALPKGTKAPAAENGTVLHDTDTDNYEKLPQWLKTKVDNQLGDDKPAKRHELGSIDADEVAAAQHAATRKPVGPDPDDDIPF